MNVRCPVVRVGHHPCPGRLVERHDRITGALAFVCEMCRRRKRGICAECDRPVQGRRGIAERCAEHRVEAQRRTWRRYWRRNPDAKVRAAENARHRHRARTIRETGRPPLSVVEKGRKAAAARNAALTREQRVAIAKKAIAARWHRRAA